MAGQGGKACTRRELSPERQSLQGEQAYARYQSRNNRDVNPQDAGRQRRACPGVDIKTGDRRTPRASRVGRSARQTEYSAFPTDQAANLASLGAGRCRGGCTGNCSDHDELENGGGELHTTVRLNRVSRKEI